MSICIASFGDDVSTLLSELSRCVHYGLPEDWSVDILISDQFPSVHPKSTEWQEHGACIYFHSTTKGRSLNRNELAQRSTGNYLLFLDADALPKATSFLYDYCSAAATSSVVVGGTAYLRDFKVNHLRSKIGIQKEELSPKARSKNTYDSFSAFNFLITRSLFLEMGFDETIQGYGHEDTMFGQQLRYRCASILHIDNPAYHIGIDENDVFMDKTQQAVDGLATLINAGKIDENVALFRTYNTLRKFKLRLVIKALNILFGASIKSALSSKHPPLFLYDVYKILRLSHHPIKIGRKMP